MSTCIIHTCHSFFKVCKFLLQFSMTSVCPIPNSRWWMWVECNVSLNWALLITVSKYNKHIKVTKVLFQRYTHNQTSPICVSKTYLKAKIKPSLVRCVPKLAYFCFIRRQMKHKTVNNFKTNRDILMKFFVVVNQDYGVEWWWNGGCGSITKPATPT